MANTLIDRRFYDAIVNFEGSEAAQDYYYSVMNAEMDRDGKKDTVRNMILRVYSMLFCDDLGALPGQIAGPDDVVATADRLHTGTMGFDRQHWYRMQHHFPVIDDDNYDRFAALVISDEAALNDGDMLLVGAPDPLHMTQEQLEKQEVRVVRMKGDVQ